jgi:hypothetical protein
MRLRLLSICLFAVFTKGVSSDIVHPKAVDFSHGRLVISDNKRYLVHKDGTPFFYFADTAWQLFHRLTREEINHYFQNRVKKGFTVIQAVILAELDGLETPNRYGITPLRNNNPQTPNEAWFEWIDEVISMAREQGLYIALVPTWGDKVDKKWGTGPEIFTIENAYEYGKYLGNRYKKTPNIIWMNGGDRSADGKNFAIWDALAKGIKSEDRQHLMTFHPQGERSSSEWFHQSDWCDFNICQTSHSQTDYGIYERLLVKDYQLNPIKPCMDAEPRYEDIPIGFNPANGRFDDSDVRQSLYWSLFSGGFGYTYGCNSIWQFYEEGRKPMCDARRSWQESLDLPGSFAIKYARALLESFDYLSRVPDQDFIISRNNNNKEKVVATRGTGYALIYIPTGKETVISLDKMNTAKQIQLSWFQPCTGIRKPIKITEAKGNYTARPATQGKGNDWVLILEEVS